MKLIRYNSQSSPWSSFDRLASFRDLLDLPFAPAGESNPRVWAPALDIHEDGEKITVNVEAAGLKKEDFDISLEDDTLTVSGERKNETETREGTSFRSERFYGRFSRKVRLSTPVKADEVKATYENGVISIVLPRAEEAKPRKISVG
jgi:HSP20 family protein